MTNSAEQIVIVNRLGAKIQEAAAIGFKNNGRALNLVSELRDAAELLEVLAHRENAA
jgi:hypothetical protein